MENTKLISRRAAIVAGAALTAPAIIGTAKAAPSVTWKVQSHWPKASASYGDSLQVIADELKEITGGRFVLLAWRGRIRQGAEISNRQKGVGEMGTISPGYILGEAPMAGLCLGVPGTFRSPWEFEHYLKNMGAEALFNDELAYHGVVSRAEKVYPTELVVSKEINSGDDFARMKLRSSGSYLKYLSAAGASAQYIAGPELYQSLASGVVDGAHWGAAQAPSRCRCGKWPSFMKPTMGLAMDTLIIDQKAVDALPEDLRTTFMNLLETRFWKRCAEYQYKEMTALSYGVSKQNVVFKQFPQAVLDKFAAASGAILDAEAGKGGNAKKGAEMLSDFLKVLGYA